MAEAAEQTTVEETSSESTEEVSAEQTTSEVTEEQTAEEAIQQEIETLRKLSLKVDGEEIEEELPFDVPKEHADYIKKQLQLAKVAQKRMQESAQDKKYINQMQNEVQAFIEALKEDPESILSDPTLNIDMKAFAEKIMAKEMEEAAKSPEQKEQEEKEARIRKLEEEKAKLQEEKRLEELRREEDKIAAEYERDITAAIESNELPNDPIVLSLIAKNLKIGMKFNLGLTVQDVVPVVKRELYEEAKKKLALLKDDELAEYIGKDRFNRIRKDMFKKLKEEKSKAPTSVNKIADGGGDVKDDVDVFAKKSKGSLKSRDYFKNPLAYLDK